MVQEMHIEKPTLAVFPSYIAMIENSVGTNLFRNRYYTIRGETIDVLEDGDLSCAVFVTSILHHFDLVEEVHTTVIGGVEDLERSGWQKISEPRKGAIILWGFKKKDDGTQGKHRHLGFYLDEQSAVSNDSDSRVVWKHHPTYGAFGSGEARRDIEALYWHPTLES
ncbi:MAG TPA: hypothetical protein VF803_02290 [Candidatus Paceibacterota bacterium]